MAYSTRNSFYLRISKRVVLPVYVYLDERHVNWMSDKILQHVLADLRPIVLSKLKSEAGCNLLGNVSGQKKASVDSLRGDAYQFCYFIRKTEPHSVVVKSRTYRAASPCKGQKLEIPLPRKRGKRKETLSLDTQKKKKRRVRSPTEVAIEDTDLVPTNDLEAAVNEHDASSPEFCMDLDIEEEMEKPKPILGLRYQGFSICGHCLCVVVEPWPVVRSVNQPPLLAGRARGVASIPSGARGGQAKAPTPLFLPEESSQELISPRKGTQINKSYLHQILNEESASDSEDDMGGILEFSQVLQNIGDPRVGGTNDDDNEDGFLLFGDADDFREL